MAANFLLMLGIVFSLLWVVMPSVPDAVARMRNALRDCVVVIWLGLMALDMTQGQSGG